MNVLIVGAGSMGRVFGDRLAAGGASVSTLVRPSQRAQAEQGYVVTRRRRWRPASTSHFKPVRVYSDPSALESDWDCVWLSVHSAALNDSFVETLSARLRGATVVTIGQGMFDRSTLERHWPPEQIVEVLPVLFAYADAGPAFDNSVSYWVPLGMPLDVTGGTERAGRIAQALRSGGLAARYGGTLGRGSLVAALNMPYFAALETADWSFERVNSRLSEVAAAASEASLVTARQLAVAPPVPFATSALSMRATFRLLRWLAPFDFDNYSRTHFTKIRVQTRQMLDEWIAAAREADVTATHLEQLRAAMPQLPSS